MPLLENEFCNFCIRLHFLSWKEPLSLLYNAFNNGMTQSSKRSNDLIADIIFER